MKQNQFQTPEALLEHLNDRYAKIHTRFENLFWKSAMGDHSVNAKKDTASAARDAFRSDESLARAVSHFLGKSKGVVRERLGYWERFFSLYQVPAAARPLKGRIDALETKIGAFRASRKEGYIDPRTKRFVVASENAMRSLMVSHEDEKVRKACFAGREALARGDLTDYLSLVALRNEYARLVGYEDFYAYKLAVEEGMTKQELFSLFDKIYAKTSYAYGAVREKEKNELPGLRKPWNLSYMLSGSFIKEEDPYFPFEAALPRWGESFAALGISYRGGSLTLDLLDRKGKYNNGFCHWPVNVYYKGNTRITATSNFTCNVVLGVPGDAHRGYETLFHEGGHAAHLLNADMKDIAMTTEYPPLSTAWAETQSMFLDTVFSSIEWASRYATTLAGEAYPFDLFERRVRKVGFMRPFGIIRSIAYVCEFERRIYESKTLTSAKVFSIAKEVHQKYFDLSTSSYSVLEVPHLYSWESACSYHGYGLATLALDQWREYFYTKYGYIVDNPKVGKEMARVWKYGAAKTFPEMIRLATGKPLSSDAYIKNVTRSDAQVIARAKDRIAALAKKPRYRKPIDLDATITLVDGTKKIADNRRGFAMMAEQYAAWLKTKYPTT